MTFLAGVRNKITAQRLDVSTKYLFVGLAWLELRRHWVRVFLERKKEMSVPPDCDL